MKEVKASTNKIWIGSIPQAITEDDLREIMEKYGNIAVLYYQQGIGNSTTTAAGGSTRGWAFVTFEDRQQALNAIQAIDGKLSFPDSDRPVEARFAHAEGKQEKHHSTANSNVINLSSSQNGSMQLNFHNADPVRYEASINACNFSSSISSLSSSIKPIYLWQQYFTAEGFVYYYNSMTGHTQWEKPLLTTEIQTILQNNIGSIPSPHNVPLLNMLNSNSINTQLNPQFNAKTNAGGKSYGPPGSNLFIFHVPNDWTDTHLKQHFNLFGNIVSCRVSTDDKKRNSGFGFVSFDNQQSAFAAIQCMNGFGVGGKHLKVQLKKGEEHLLPVEFTTNNLNNKSI